MRSLLLAALFLLPTTSFAACYSKSDCLAGQVCKAGMCSLPDAVIHNAKKENDTVAPVVPKVPKPAAPKPVVVSSAAASSKKASSSSVSSVSAKSSSSSSVAAVDQGIIDSLTKSMKSVMDSLASMAKGITNTMNSMLTSVKCAFGGCS